MAVKLAREEVEKSRADRAPPSPRRTPSERARTSARANAPTTPSSASVSTTR